MPDNNFFLSSWSDQPSGGIYEYRLDECGEPFLKNFATLRKAGYLAWSVDRKTMYATCAPDESGDGVAAFRVKSGGGLSLLNIVKSGGKSCCHLTVSPDGGFVYAANYASSNFAEFKILPDGSLAPSPQIIQHHGHGLHEVRQTVPHPHFVQFTPDGKFLTVADLGLDAVKFYPFTPSKGIDTKNVITNQVTPGDGPRHLVFASNGKLVYLITELSNMIRSYSLENGILSPVSSLALLPAGVKSESKAAAIRMTSDEKNIVASNRGFDTLVAVRLNGRGGLEIADITFSGGSSPRDINFMPDEKIIAAAHEATGNVCFFDFDAAGGRLTPSGNIISGMARPLCVLQG